MPKFLEQYKEAITNGNSWPVQEAKRIIEKIGNKVPEKGYVLFEGGYGPSGFPHIGTFGEMVRTSFVRFAFTQLAPHIPTKLFVVSDDLDGMRKIPDTVPDKGMLKNYIGFPLTSVPSPFGEGASYGDYMNSRLVRFLDNFGFDYEFVSATKYYKEGKFDEYLIKCSQNYQALMDIMLPTLGEERRSTYSPFMPIDPETGMVIDKGVIKVDSKTCLIHYLCDGKEKTVDFRKGGCKLQWKCDFGMRWAALGVDYELYGKDHFPNEPVYRAICNALGKEPPVNYFYELFLDENGEKISKSKGNGVTVEEWLKYANIESLAYYMYLKPRTAKKLYFDVIPKAVDEYITFLNKYSMQTSEQQVDNPVFFVNEGEPKKQGIEISFGLLLNLAATSNPEDEKLMWGFIKKYNPNLEAGKNALLDELVIKSVNYYNNFVKPFKNYKIPNEQEKTWLKALSNEFEKTQDKTAANLQNITYEVGKTTTLGDAEWFKLLYQVLLGLETGPRFGTFVALYGVDNMINLIKKTLNS